MKAKSLEFYLIHLIVLTIIVACILMNGPMRGGLPLDNTLVERMAFIASNRVIWSISWFVWMLSALGLFVFCSILASKLPPGLWRAVGLALVGMGIAPDLIAEVIYAFVMPEVLRLQLGQDVFALLEVLAMHLTGFLGNGLYNLGGLLLTLLVIRQGVISGWIAAWGVTAWVLGLLLSLSVALGSVSMAEVFTASSMVLSTVWMLIYAHKVLKV